MRPCGQFFSTTGNGLNFEILKHITRWSDFCHERDGDMCIQRPAPNKNQAIYIIKFVPSLDSLGVHI